MASFIVLLAIIIALGAVFYAVMSDFFVPLFMAVLLVVIFHPMHDWLVLQLHGRKRIAGIVSTLIILLLILIPAAAIITFAVAEAISMGAQIKVADVSQKLAEVRKKVGVDVPNVDTMRALQESITTLQQDLSKGDDPTRHLNRFANLLAKLQENLPTETPGLEPLVLSAIELKDKEIGSLEFDRTMESVSSDFQGLRLKLYGGPLRAWAVEAANPSDEQIKEWRTVAIDTGQSWLVSITGSTTAYLGKFVLACVILTVSVYFFLTDGHGMIQSIMRLSPLDDTYERELIQEFDRVSRAVVVATLLSAVAQGLLAGLGFWLAGVDSVFLLTLVTIVCSMIPFVGAAAVWVPVCIYLYLVDERLGAAVILGIYGAGIVSMADNVIKPWVLHGQSNLHPLMALLSVLGGVKTLGPIGILVGPMIAAFLQVLLNMLHRELTHMESDSLLTQTIVGAGAGADGAIGKEFTESPDNPQKATPAATSQPSAQPNAQPSAETPPSKSKPAKHSNKSKKRSGKRRGNG
jgi:predicted PurR-regulated permease PerM